jgi:hypothetical protein
MLGVLVYFVLSAAFIILSSLLFVYLFKKNNLRFEQALPLSLMSIALLMFFLTLAFHNITLSVAVTIITQLLCLAVLIVLDKKRKDTIVRFLKSPALIFFIVLVAALYAVNYGRVLTSFDDLIHWGPFVTDTLRLNDFYNASTNLAFSVHGDYPPVATMFEVFYMKITANQEWLMFVAIQILCLSMFFPLLSKIEWKKKLKLKTVVNTIVIAGLILGALSTIELQTNASFFFEIRIDTLLACVMAYGVYIAYTEGKSFTITTVVKLSLVVTFMLLVKQVAIVMAAILALLYVAMLFAYRQERNPLKGIWAFVKKRWIHVALILVALAIPVLSLKLWGTQVAGCLKDTICTQQFSSSSIKPLGIPSILIRHSGTALQQDTARHFVNYIYTGQVVINSDIFKPTYPQFILLFCGGMLAVAIYAHRKKQPIKDILIVAGVVLFGYFMYLFALLGTYLYGGFNDGEMQILASADRYIGTYLLIMLLVLVITFINVWAKGSKPGNSSFFISGGIIVLALCLILNATAYKSVVPYSLLNFSGIDRIDDFRAPLDVAINTAKSDKDFSDSSIVMLAECNEQAGIWESDYIRYHVRPNPYLVLRHDGDEGFTRNTDYAPAQPYVDPAGRPENNSPHDVSVYVIAMCSGTDLQKYNNQKTKLVYFDKTTGIQEKWQVFKTTAKGDYYNTLNQELDHLVPIGN